MPDKTGRFNPQEQAFVAAMAGTGDATFAATKAGYAFPLNKGANLMQKPAIRDAVASTVAQRLDSLVVLTLDVFYKILSDEKAPNKDRIAVGKAVVTAWNANNAVDSERKDASEMTGDELRDSIAKARARLAEMAAPVLELEAKEHQDTDEDGVFA